MRFLVLGGTAFLSEAVAAEALRRGHEVVCACRGSSGSVPEGARLVRWDRAADAPPVDEVGPVDAVVDVARHPSRVRSAVAAWPDAHWVFVSTINVYVDDMAPHGTPVDTSLQAPEPDDVDLAERPEAYGPMKVACEQAVTTGAASSAVVRPGLIAGPGDPSGRFSYWPERLAAAADGEEVLAGGDPTDLVQVVDVRDLAAWLVTIAEQRTTGHFDGTSTETPIGDLLTQVAEGVGSSASLTWASSELLTANGVDPWMGPESLPLWLPRPEHDGMMTRDVRPSLAAGLVLRPFAETARDTLAWLRATPDAVRTGLSREREEEVLKAARAG